LEPSNIKAYANDGLGTPVKVSFKPINIDIKERNQEADAKIRNDLAKFISNDNEAPVIVSIDLGRDESLFDNQKFISILATDFGSGLDYFEAKEGDREAVRTDGQYVLQNQDKLEAITVYAFDKAGNVSRKVFTPEMAAKRIQSNWVYVIASILILFSIYLLCRLFIKKRKNK